MDILTGKRNRGDDILESDFENLEKIHYEYINLCLTNCGIDGGNEPFKIMLENYMQIILRKYQIQSENTITELMLLREAIYALYQFGDESFFTFYSLLFCILPRDIYQNYYDIFMEAYMKMTNTSFKVMEPELN